jgi:predicted DNA-binding helix-hairpin-helix protein
MLSLTPMYHQLRTMMNTSNVQRDKISCNRDSHNITKEVHYINNTIEENVISTSIHSDTRVYPYAQLNNLCIGAKYIV